MLRKLGLTVLLAITLGSAGCAARYWDSAAPGSRITGPPPGTSLVYFVQPDLWSLRDAAFIFDDLYFVGAIGGGGHIAYVTVPGRHLFMVTSEAADFLEAELLPDRTYYVNVVRRWGISFARFSLAPAIQPDSIARAKALAANSTQLRQNDTARRWETGKHETIARLKISYFSKWEARPDRPFLPANAGE